MSEPIRSRLNLPEIAADLREQDLVRREQWLELSNADERNPIHAIRTRLAVSTALSSWTTVTDSGPRLLEAMISQMSSTVATLWLPEEDVLVARATAATGDLAGSGLDRLSANVRLPQGIGIAGSAWQAGTLVHRTSLAGSRPYPGYSAPQLVPFKTAAALPALAGDTVVAVIDLHSCDRFELTELSFLTLTGIGYEIGTALSSKLRPQARNPLTTREQEVLALAADGLTTAQIASQLTVEASTVKTHLLHIHGKLEAPDRAAAVARALRCGLID